MFKVPAGSLSTTQQGDLSVMVVKLVDHSKTFPVTKCRSVVQTVALRVIGIKVNGSMVKPDTIRSSRRRKGWSSFCGNIMFILE